MKTIASSIIAVLFMIGSASAQDVVPSFQQGTVASPLQGVPAEGRVVVTSGKPTAIYGQRAQDCGAAPSWAYAMEKLSKQPVHGSLSDGGIGVRRSRSCGATTYTRVIVYSSAPGYQGSDEIEFGGHDSIRVEVVPAQ